MRNLNVIKTWGNAKEMQIKTTLKYHFLHNIEKNERL